MKRRWKVVLGLLGLAVLTFAVVASGVIPITASSGHWPTTRWFLQFAMRRSVATHSIGIHPPELDDRALILRGAGHFHGGCRPCHGPPAGGLPPIPHQMTPHPPRLEAPIREMDAGELFYIVKHGVKFTGMPAWPAQHRDDEVWAVVAFLRVYPALDAAEYEALVHGSPAAGSFDAPEVVRDTCVRCHGLDGLGRGAFPKLAGQRRVYLEASLEAYARSERHSGIMEPIAAALSAQARRRAAAYYAALPSMGASDGSSRSSDGASIARFGLPEQRVPACADCHGPSEHPTSPFHPRLAGQREGYLRRQLELFAAGHRGGTPYAPVMRKALVHGLEPSQMRAVASYYAGLRTGG